MSGKPRRPTGADLLHLHTAWAAGARLAAGACLLSHEPVPKRLFAEPCPVTGCHKILCGPTERLAAERLAAHRRCCHA